MYLFLLAVIMDRKSQLRAERGSMVVAVQPLRGSTLGGVRKRVLSMVNYVHGMYVQVVVPDCVRM